MKLFSGAGRLFTRNRIYFALAVILAVSAFATSQRLIKNTIEEKQKEMVVKTVMVVVPIRDLPKGATVSEGDVQQREVPQDTAHEAAVRPDQFFDTYRGRKLAFDVRAHEPLLAQFFEAPTPKVTAGLTEGFRAITIPVDEQSSFGQTLQPGNRIDLVATVKLDGKSILKPLLSNVPVMATGSSTTEAGNGKETRRFSTVTLRVSPEDAERVMAAREVGKLTALLRAPQDESAMSDKRQDALTLVGVVDPRPPAAPHPPRAASGLVVVYGIAPAAAPNPMATVLAALGNQLGSVAKAPGKE